MINSIHTNLQKKNHQVGFSLLEILIAIVIVSLGLLGIVQMQVSNIQFINNAKQRSEAIQLTNDIIDRMRANVAETVNGSYNIGFGGALKAPTNCTSATANCNPATLAAYDLASWLCQLGGYNANTNCTSLGLTGHLPSGQGRISYDSSTDTTTVGVRWTDLTDKSKNKSITVNVRL